jgi:hypothetical protein
MRDPVWYGQEIWVSGKIFEKIRRRMKWHSKITFLKAHEYIDEMLSRSI